jgi:hypothetical protein
MSQTCNTSPAEGGHIIITGTGRSGTTLLVQLFTALGFETGFTLEEALSHVDNVSQAGLEHWITDETGQTVMKSPLKLGVPNYIASDKLPYVIKSPMFATNLRALLESNVIRVKTAIVPMRDLFSAAESRRRVQWEAEKIGIDPDHVQGGLWDTRDPAVQESVLTQHFYEMMFTLVQFGVKTYCLDFPTFTRSSALLFERLEPLLTEHGVRENDVAQALSRIVRPGQIHDFHPRPGSKTPAGAAT